MDNLEIAYNAEKSWPTAIITSGECYRRSGGMPTESQNFIEAKYPNDSRYIYLYGKELNKEIYAICK